MACPPGVDRSSGALGSATNKTVHELSEILLAAPAQGAHLERQLDRLWTAIEEDGVDSLGRNDGPSDMARTCEEILLAAGRCEDAYRRFAYTANRAGSHLATFRAIRPSRRSTQTRPPELSSTT